MQKIIFSQSLLSGLNSSYFYDRLHASLVESGTNIPYGDFAARIMKNGAVKVLKSLGIYKVQGKGDGKVIFIHERLMLIINTTIADNNTIAKTVVNLVNGYYTGIPFFEINDLTSFYELSDDYPSSIDGSKCTYIIFNPNNRLHKIGKASNVFSRLNSLRSQLSPDLEIVAYLESDVEMDLHKRYKSKREFGEWFRLTNDDILDIKNNYSFILISLFL